MKVPVLETPRLILRGFRREDFPAHAAMWSDPRTRRYFLDLVYSEEDTWMRFQRGVGQWQLSRYGLWALQCKDDGAYAGGLGFIDARRTIELPYRDDPEAAWVIAPDLHGRGLAREAMTAAIAWLDRNIEAPQSWCMINPDNAPSLKLAAALGYRPALEAAYKDHPMQTFTRSRGGAA